jgi:hypothetical protein
MEWWQLARLNVERWLLQAVLLLSGLRHAGFAVFLAVRVCLTGKPKEKT